MLLGNSLGDVGGGHCPPYLLSFNSTKDWMGDLVESKGLTPQKVSKNLQNFIDFADDKADYLGAFLDMSTNYYEHTGIQTLARRLIERAVAEI